MNDLVKGHIIFDHDGTLVKVTNGQFQLFEGMWELLEELQAEKFTLSIWTARPRNSTLEIIKRLGIAHFFMGIYCYDDGLPKPHPAGLAKLTDGFTKDKILHIGDSYTDIDGAKEFGIDVIAACWNDPKQKTYFETITPLLATSIDECKKIIRGKYV
jgi:phosphoglycolate phosphatase-like HAD superfamily hydrolase